MRILIVGGTSFIAGHLIARLAARDLEVSATCRESRGSNQRVRWIRTDLASPDATAGWPSRCDAVIYLAQSRAWREFPAGAPDVFAINVGGVARAADYAHRAGASHFLLASTGTVYEGLPATTERTAIDVTQPRHFYPASKLAAEMLLAGYAGVMHAVIFRIFMPYGSGQDPSMLIPQLIRRIQQGIPIQLDGFDGLSANPVAVGDVAKVFEAGLAFERSLTVNIAGPEVLSLRQIAMTIGRVVVRSPIFEHRDGVPKDIVGDTAKLAQTLGWLPQTSFEAGLKTWLAGD